MHDLTPNEIKKIASDILQENGFTEASKIWMIVDVNQSTILINFKAALEHKNISIVCKDIEDYKKKFTNQVKIIHYKI